MRYAVWAISWLSINRLAMKHLQLLLSLIIALICESVAAQQAVIKVLYDHTAMVYAQGYEYEDGCEFVIKDSCRVEDGRGTLRFDMQEDVFVNILLLSDNDRFLDEVVVGADDSLTLYYTNNRMIISEDKRRYREQYSRFGSMRDSLRCKHSDLQNSLYSVRYNSRQYHALQDSLNMVKAFYHKDFPYILLNDNLLSQSVYIVSYAIAILSNARVAPEELDSLRTTFSARLPHAKSLKVTGERHTERSLRDQHRFFELLRP